MFDHSEITEENFDQYFFDIRKNNPQRGQVMACYTSVAYLINGKEKKNLIDLLKVHGKMIAATQVMRKLFCASEYDSYHVPKMMIEDMLAGMSVEECLEKEYKYTVEMFYFTKEEHVPKDDPHWTIVSVLNLDEFLDKEVLSDATPEHGT